MATYSWVKLFTSRYRENIFSDVSIFSMSIYSRHLTEHNKAKQCQKGLTMIPTTVQIQVRYYTVLAKHNDHRNT